MNTLPHTTAALLHSARYALPAQCVLGGYTLLQGGGWAAAGIVLLASISVLQLRMAFDQAIFRAWAQGESTPQDFDHSLHALGITHPGERSLAARCQGAGRLFRLWMGVSVLQVLVTLGAALLP